ncbi:hypothetical protein [Helicobacter pylori]|uniref:hypothetical protein n=1 Tax=Helicobacter pylori TaxID=210 RepID=UPI0000D839CC|nr:hypothetical protein [Helicobacter pylori]ABF85073.1 hypothetical protein HPAG1_1006 [Helicobacter pylori HPAG1]MCQ2936445.1 hypothetical protein [Helicobacter pylori]PUB96160.1 hypothetical protein C2S43_05655 [Helicobacter pylori]PUB99490.1 hypothetical protein C2S02_06010 [Helicobacter pylori]WQW36955.1 hypothetical protein KVK38_01710 [Helicobacter pylori]
MHSENDSLEITYLGKRYKISLNNTFSDEMKCALKERFHNQELNALELLKDYLHESCQNEYLHNELQKLLEKISSCSIT